MHISYSAGRCVSHSIICHKNMKTHDDFVPHFSGHVIRCCNIWMTHGKIFCESPVSDHLALVFSHHISLFPEYDGIFMVVAAPRDSFLAVSYMINAVD